MGNSFPGRQICTVGLERCCRVMHHLGEVGSLTDDRMNKRSESRCSSITGTADVWLLHLLLPAQAPLPASARLINSPCELLRRRPRGGGGTWRIPQHGPSLPLLLPLPPSPASTSPSHSAPSYPHTRLCTPVGWRRGWRGGEGLEGGDAHNRVNVVSAEAAHGAVRRPPSPLA